MYRTKCRQEYESGKGIGFQKECSEFTGKSFSDVLIFASTNPQYDNRLFIELPVQYMKIPSSEHGENMRRTYCVQNLFRMSETISVHN